MLFQDAEVKQFQCTIEFDIFLYSCSQTSAFSPTPSKLFGEERGFHIPQRNKLKYFLAGVRLLLSQKLVLPTRHHKDLLSVSVDFLLYDRMNNKHSEYYIIICIFVNKKSTKYLDANLHKISLF